MTKHMIKDLLENDKGAARAIVAKLEDLDERITNARAEVVELGEQLIAADGHARALRARLSHMRHALYSDMTRAVPRDATTLTERQSAMTALAGDVPRAEAAAKELKSKLGRARQAVHFEHVRREKALRSLAELRLEWVCRPKTEGSDEFVATLNGLCAAYAGSAE